MGYPMSYLEFFGTIFNLWCVWLTARGKVSCWPIGMVGIILYVFLFYQIQLYSDLTEQIYFLLMSIYGWWMWTHCSLNKKTNEKKRLEISHNIFRENLVSVLVIVLGSVAMGYFMSNIHLYLPKYFSIPASFPYLDALTTVMSFVATVLMARKKVECWYLWILVDIIGIGLYYAKGVKFIALEYLIFLVLATNGFLTWKKEVHQDKKVLNYAYE
jgi:nicotinamide mononucleotide transporter